MPPVFITMLHTHMHAFPDALPLGLPPRRCIDHTIPIVPGSLPPKGGIYKMEQAMRLAQKEILRDLAEQGKITHTVSPFGAPCMMVPKKAECPGGDIKYRMVVNYQALNKITITAEHPIPTVASIMDQLHGAKYFTLMDMESGFHQVRVAPEDQYKTAFRTIYGHFEYKVMPFGLKGAPGTFQAIMNDMLIPFLDIYVAVYLDDVLIYSRTLDDHILHVHTVLERLSAHQMYPKLSKCRFCQERLDYLGHSIGADGIKPADAKIQDIAAWPLVLKNVTEVHQFLGTVGYVRMFMGTKFADIAEPLVRLTKKGVPFSWSQVHVQAMKDLKERLIHYTTLSCPDPNKPYHLYTDASGFAMGAVLEQEGAPIGFLSKKFNEAQMKYSTYNQELLAMVTALKKWQHLLAPAEVTAFTDHQALKHLLSLKAAELPRGMQARWLDFLAEFPGLTITYKPGKDNVVADALSRNPLHAVNPLPRMLCTRLMTTSNPVVAHTILEHPQQASAPGRLYTVRRVNPPTPEGEGATPALLIGTREWTTALRGCPELTQVVAAAEQAAPAVIKGKPEGFSRAHNYRWREGILLVHTPGGWRYAVPANNTIRMHILYQFHDHPTAGHMGFNKTLASLAHVYYWDGMGEYVKGYTDTCTRCQASKSACQKPAGLLQSLQIPTRRWGHVSMDFVTGLPVSTQGNDSILVVVDLLSKMSHFIPMPTTADAPAVAEYFMTHVVRLHGVPEKIISDRDSRFVSVFWGELMARCQIKRALSSAWHPQSDGQTERTNRTLEQMLRVFIRTDETQWESLLPALELAYNSAPHASTKVSPFQTMIGENPPTSKAHEFISHMIVPPLTRTFRMLVDRAIHHIQRAQERQQAQADKHRRDLTFAIGDRVWLSTRNLLLDGTRKLQERWVGPYPVLARIGQVAYKLALPPSMTVHPVFHVSLLKPFKDSPRYQRQEDWAPITQDGQPEYEVEAILAVRGAAPNREYHVKWKGYGIEDCTWVPETHLTGAPRLIRAFWRNQHRQSNTNAAA